MRTMKLDNASQTEFDVELISRQAWCRRLISVGAVHHGYLEQISVFATAMKVVV